MTTTLIPRKRRHSMSSLDTYECPARYRAIYEDGVRDESAAALRGRGFHEAASHYIRALADAGQSDSVELAVVALSHALETCALSVDLMREVEWLFWRWAEKFRLDVDAFLLAEERQEDEFVFIPDVVYVHEATDTLAVWDWKTYYVALTAAQAMKEFQTLFYLWQARRAWPGFSRYTMTYAFPRLNVEPVTVEVEQAEIDAFERYARSLVANIENSRETGYWPAVPGKHCRFCRLECSVARPGVNVPARVTTAEEASDLAARLLVVDRDAKALRGALKGWLTEYGPVEVGSMVYGLESQTTRSFKLEDVLAVLVAHGIDTPKVKLSATALSSYLKTKKHRAIGEELLPLAEEKIKTLAKWRKLADDDPEEDDEEPAE